MITTSVCVRDAEKQCARVRACDMIRCGWCVCVKARMVVLVGGRRQGFPVDQLVVGCLACVHVSVHVAPAALMMVVGCVWGVCNGFRRGVWLLTFGLDSTVRAGSATNAACVPVHESYETWARHWLNLIRPPESRAGVLAV